MTITKYRPQAAYITPFNELVNDLFSRDIGQFFGQDDLRKSIPKVNIIERDSEFELSLIAPGFSKADITLRVEDDTLTISAEQKAEELSENERYTRREFSRNAFTRGFRLPKTVDHKGIKAGYADGILRVAIPKAEDAKPKAREIGIE